MHDFKEQHQYQTLLQEKNLNEDIKKAFSALFYENETEEQKNEASDTSSIKESNANIENLSTIEKATE